MDIAACLPDYQTRTLQFSGAYNPLIIVRNGEVLELKADRMPIGVYITDTNAFSNHTVEMLPGDSVYMFTDGYASQFGGPDGHKFQTRNLRNLLLDISERSMRNTR